MLTSIQNKTAFNGSLYGIAGENKSKLLGPVHICPFGDTEIIRRINRLPKQNSVQIKQSNFGYKKMLIFEMPKEEYKQNITLWARLSPLLSLSKGQEILLNNNTVTSLKFELPKDDYQFVKESANIIPINIVNNIRIKKFEQKLRSFFQKPNEQEWLNSFFNVDESKYT